MKNKQIFLVMALFFSIFSMIFPADRKNNSFLSEMMAVSPIKMLAGQYFIAKDFIHAGLGAHIPHVVVQRRNVTYFFPSECSPIQALKENYSKGISHRGVYPCIRYRNFGIFLLGLAAGKTHVERIRHNRN